MRNALILLASATLLNVLVPLPAPAQNYQDLVRQNMRSRAAESRPASSRAPRTSLVEDETIEDVEDAEAPAQTEVDEQATPQGGDQTQDQQAQASSPQVEVVFVMDTTGSMAGLIEGAKDTVWSIANTLANAQPTPQIKMGLVGYRDRGDAYVVKKTELSSDLDKVYGDLMAYSAAGGGDTPEAVTEALGTAVREFPWSSNPNTYRVIFLVGDAPPHASTELSYQGLIGEAAQKNIVVNTIQCGTMAETTPHWKEMAMLGKGEFFQIDASGGVETVETPYDSEIAALSEELDETTMFYGTERERRAEESRKEAGAALAARASAPAAADRALFNASKAGATNFAGKKDLVSGFLGGSVKLENVRPDMLPTELRGKSTEEQKAVISDLAKKREATQARIAELGKKRDAYISSHRAASGGSATGFDSAVRQALAKQTAKKGLKIEKK